VFTFSDTFFCVSMKFCMKNHKSSRHKKKVSLEALAGEKLSFESKFLQTVGAEHEP
jgi:hypothetical protein